VTCAFLRYQDAEGLGPFEELRADREAIEAEFAAAGLSGLAWRTEGEERILSLTCPSPLPWDAAREAE